jgi:hypothetical protein
MADQLNSSTQEDELRKGLVGIIHNSSSRRSFLRRSAIAAAVVAPTGLLAACGQPLARASSTRTAAVAARAQSQSYAQIEPISSSGAQFMEIQSDENQHVSYLKSALGSSARPEPTFQGLDQSDINSFATLSRTFENLGVSAYLFAAPAISSKSNLAAAASILTVEARHAGFLDVLQNQPLSPNGAFDKPGTQSGIVSAVSPFISSLNGGPDPSAPLTNDTDILNFALLLEYLESSFYNINVPKFFGTTGRG